MSNKGGITKEFSAVGGILMYCTQLPTVVSMKHNRRSSCQTQALNLSDEHAQLAVHEEVSLRSAAADTWQLCSCGGQGAHLAVHARHCGAVRTARLKSVCTDAISSSCREKCRNSHHDHSTRGGGV